ncbi:MAG: Bug family tripartite tricarboxylate transporter substrate binding protein [Rhodospirillaceae bacterium]
MLALRWLAAAAALAALAATTPVHAQAWPQHPVRIYVGFGGGSTPDLMARMLAENLQKHTGQPFVVENKPGAGGNIAADTVAKATPDGHFLGATIPGPMIVNPMIMETPYDPKRDLRPITIVGTQPSVLVAATALNVATLADLIALLKKNPGKYNYASIGVGSISQLSMELIAQQSGTEVVHVPYKSSPDAVKAVTTGEAHLAALPPLAVTGPAKAGQLNLLAVTTPRRWPTLPDVPTFAEAGLPAVQAEAWMALVAPAKTPDAVVARIYDAVKAVLAKPEALEQIKKLAFEPVGNSPAEFAARLQEEETRWAAVVDKLGLRKK